MPRKHLLLLLSLATCTGTAWAQPTGSPLTPQRGRLSSAAERVYAAAQPRLLQVRTLLESAGRQSSTGSGFLVSAEGLAITNYHVVSQYVLEPSTYRLEYVAPDGARGSLKLLAIDIANDLAVVQREQRGQPFFRFDVRALKGTLPKGERLYAMGNPLDLGFTIVEGTYNGLVERSYNERIHFSGAINPGMSGGPTVTADGRIVGINVAKRLGGELVSFLVPARFATALIDRAHAGQALARQDSRVEIGRQLTAWQAGLYKAIEEHGFRATSFGPYRAPESTAPWFTCWAQTNADRVPKPRATIDATNCSTDTWLFVAGDLYTGRVHITHSYVKSIDLNPFQFATFVSPQYRSSWTRMSGKRHTRQSCHEDFLSAPTSGGRPPLRSVWCARAYRDFEGLFDVSVTVVTQDRDREALVSRLGMHGITYANAVALTRGFLGAVKWAK